MECTQRIPTTLVNEVHHPRPLYVYCTYSTVNVNLHLFYWLKQIYFFIFYSEGRQRWKREGGRGARGVENRDASCGGERQHSSLTGSALETRRVSVPNTRVYGGRGEETNRSHHLFPPQSGNALTHGFIPPPSWYLVCANLVWEGAEQRM